MRPIPGICERCGLRYNLKDLQEEFFLGMATGTLVCKSCWDPTHPQLDTRNIKTDDKQSVDDPRSDGPELPEERRLYAWRPWVGCPATSTATVHGGRVTVTTT